MATPPPHQFSILAIFFSFISLLASTAHSKLDLHPSDLKAIGALGLVKVNGQPCHSHGVYCERRLSDHEPASYVLRVTRLLLASSNLTGTLSTAVGRLTELKELSLRHNNLVDRIPHTIVHLTKLEILDLSNNRLTGEVPPQLSALTRLRVLDVSSNRLSGNLNFLKYFPNLEKLNVADNLFDGRVPNSIRSFRNLRQFNFSGNRFLQGSSPIAIATATATATKILDQDDSVPNSLPKRFVFAEESGLDVSAPGPSPKPRPNRRNTSYISSPAPSPSQARPRHHHKKSKRKVLGWILGFAAGAFAGTLSGFVFSLLFKVALAVVKGGGKKSGPAIFSPLIKKAEDLAFLDKEDGLANLELIGKGGSGEVYKAELPGSNGKMIAIKKIVQPPKDAAELAEEDTKQLNKKMMQIKAEIKTVGHIRHRNLLPLLAHVSRQESHYLVYEYMKNGSLQDLLVRVENGEVELEWLTRHKIAVGVAAGLEYLHMNHTPKIIHRDLKPANILLDDDMEARIADFGLAKAMPDTKTHITTSKVAGTVGYIAPEYHQILKFTDKCDIYSFGVVLGVLVIGKFPSDPFFQSTDEMSIVKWMRKVLSSEDPKEAIDPRLLGNGYEEQMLLVLKIACFCTMDDPKERPNSKDVSAMLSQIKH